MPESPPPDDQTIAVSLTQGTNAAQFLRGVPSELVDEWFRLTWELGEWWKERGYDVKVTAISVSLNGRNATLNVTPQ
jgi:hypothetical protein